MIDKSNLSRLTIIVFVLMCGALSNAAADDIMFDVTAASFTPWSGYGIDADERAGTATLLDVRFDTSGFLAQSFMLNSIDDSKTFAFGTVELRELNAHGGIQPEETDLLGVEAYLTFLNPLDSIQAVTATGTATTGSVSDNHLDYTIVWDPVEVSFEGGGSFGISLSPLYFNDKNVPQTQTATITLLQLLPEDAQLLFAGVPVHAPEPTSLLLLGTGIGALGLVEYRRRRE
jgi:hypothetical protein